MKMYLRFLWAHAVVHLGKDPGLRVLELGGAE
jgi:hypothetical protein